MNSLLGSENLRFTLDIWNVDATGEDESIVNDNERINLTKVNGFPFLYMNLKWRMLKSEGKVK